MRAILWGMIPAALMAVASAASAADPARPSLQDSFRLGSGGTSLCRVQSNLVDPAIAGMFDRAWTIVCRDAARPVGRLYALRGDKGDPLNRLAALRRAEAACDGPGESIALDGLKATEVITCRLNAADVGYRVYLHTVNARTTYVAEGLAGYDSALQLGLRTIVADRFVPGEISILTSAAGDPAAFARVQAGTLDAGEALAEGYRRNNSGAYAEASEFFDSLLQRSAASGQPAAIAEYRINRALQQSNLGAFEEADRLFGDAAPLIGDDPVLVRLDRNFRAIHALNRRDFAGALAVLDLPVAAIATAAAGQGPAEGVIDPATAARINSNIAAARELSAVRSTELTPVERAAILDAQALQLRGTVARLQGRDTEATAALTQAVAGLLAVRDGRVTSITRMRAQAISDLALLAEKRGDRADAEAQWRGALALLEGEYPGSVAASGAKARLAAYLARSGQVDAALALYREIVASRGSDAIHSATFGDELGPYFALLAERIGQNPSLAADFFAATQTLVRPGVASTQAVLAQELSAGDDESASLFRQAQSLSREIERTRVAIARLTSDGSADVRAQALFLTGQLDGLEVSQTTTQARLSAYPRFRAVTTQALSLADLQASLTPDEAYFKLAAVDGAIYGMLVRKTAATAWRSSLGEKALTTAVSALRESISKQDNGRVLTYAFDIGASRQLYESLFGPAGDDLGDVRHLIFEPDGAMLELPLGLLVADRASVQRYHARVQAGGDEFDFTGTAWLGRALDLSTSVSARAFRDVRAVPASAAPRPYLGFGQNTPVDPVARLTLAALPVGASDGCEWPLAAWSNPISAAELRTASAKVGGTNSIVTGAAFTDSAVEAMPDLNQYRVLHFATHGLVTAPRADCPARPALLTSFDPRPAPDGTPSDGLLSFKDIYDLKLDADLVILSACDTAGAATVAATREAGVTGGGGFALDGLVRAFVGAGGRSVIASHWPSPDDYQATERLIAGLFDAPPNSSIGTALRLAGTSLMDQPDTSHPYYWAGFAMIGDGARPMIAAR